MVESVFLIKPAYRNSYYKYTDLPAGLGYISHALDRAGIENTVFDMYQNEDGEQLLNAISEFNPTMIGLSLMSFKFLEHYKLIDAIKSRFSDVPIVAGGPHVSMLRQDVLKKCRNLDFGITLEGDETIVELCRRIDSPASIKGLLYREGGEVIYTGDRAYIEDLDGIGFPTYDKFDLERYDFVSVITSRGCPYKCTYCPVLYTIGKQWRYRSAKSVGEELEYWYKKGMYRFEFGDDNFTLKKDRVFEICDEIEKRALKGIQIGLGNGIRADRVNREMLARMKEVGFTYVAFGVEAGNNKVLKTLKKGETIKQIENGIKWACELDFPVHLFFLLGAPGETEEDVRDSVNLALKYPVEDVRFYNLIPFQQSELYDWVEKNDLFLRSPEDHLNDASHWVFSPLFHTPELSKDDRIRLLKWANEITEKHTDKVKVDRFKVRLAQKGVPPFLIPLVAFVAYIKYVRHILDHTPLGKMMKGLFYKRDM